jgi:basic amino acid/polyamine antiporter, APA family
MENQVSDECNKQSGLYSTVLITILGINVVIGAGTFAMPIELVKYAGAGGILTIILAAICLLFVGLAIARVAFLIPEHGSFYSYVSAWGGKLLGVAAVFSYMLGLILCIGILVKYVSRIIAIYSTNTNIDHIGYFIVLGIFLGMLLSSSFAKTGNIVLFVMKIFPLIFIGLICASRFSFSNFTPFLGESGFTGVFDGMSAVLFAFLGFESISAMSSKTKNPQRAIPIATLAIILSSTVIYVLFVSLIIGSVNREVLLSKNILSDVLLSVFPSFTWIVHLINFSMIVMILGSAYSISVCLNELFRSFIKKVSDGKHSISTTLSCTLICMFLIVAFKKITNIGTTFGYVAILVTIAYLLTMFYLIARPKNNSDLWIGAIGILSGLTLFGSAILQLI